MTKPHDESSDPDSVAERRRLAKVQVERLLEEGLDSGPGQDWTKEDWEDIRREIRERHTRRNGNL
jgi:hypothetical protein